MRSPTTNTEADLSTRIEAPAPAAGQRPRPEPALDSGRLAAAARAWRIDWFERAVLAAFAAVSVWVLALDVWHAIGTGRVWTGGDGFWATDQFQYMAWVQDASRHLLVSNLFVLRSTPHDYFQPAIAVSGGLSALGVAPWLSLLVWQPIAVVATFYAIRGFVNRLLPDRGARLAALVLALFFGSFTIVYGVVQTIGDLFPPFLAWGYPFALLGMAAMVAGLLLHDRARTTGSLRWLPGVLGAVASLLHPWNGALLIAAVLGGEAVVFRRGPGTLARTVQPALTVVPTALGLLYYVALGKIDISWALGQAASKHAYPLWPIVLELAPLLLPALLGFWERPRTFLGAATRVWPIAAFALFEISTTRFAATPVHAFQGITIPLSVLAVQGVRRVGFGRLPRPVVWGSVLVAAFTIPATVSQLKLARRMVRPQVGNANFISTDEHHALQYLARDPRPGGVIAQIYLGQVVPAETGRQTFLGSCLWSTEPSCGDRSLTVWKLFSGQMRQVDVRQLVRSLHVRFLLTDCRQTSRPDKLYPQLVVAVHRFGCATVYDVGPPGRI
jgi:hypothetical protein